MYEQKKKKKGLKVFIEKHGTLLVRKPNLPCETNLI
jgi:hypothetical protein